MSLDVSLSTKENKELTGRVRRAIDFWTKNQVLVGVPEEESARKENDGHTNASLLYFHSKGSPIQRIPARPVLEIGIKNAAPVVEEILKNGMQAALNGSVEGAEQALNRAGMFASNKVKEVFGSSELVPNRPMTIEMKGSDAPLIDTGQLRNAITFVVRKK